MAAVIEEIATEAPRALPRSAWRDIAFPILIALLLLIAVVAVALATNAFGADPMAGT
jgi:hypothetical protein